MRILLAGFPNTNERAEQVTNATCRSKTVLLGRKGLPFGFVHYPPFTSSRTHNGIGFSLIRALADVLKTKVHPHKYLWGNWQDDLAAGRILTMGEPIMPSLGRSFNVVPYCELVTNVLIVPERLSERVHNIGKKVTESVSRVAEMAACRHPDLESELRGLRAAILPLQKLGKGLAAIKGNTDANTLDLLGIPIARRLAGTDISMSAYRAALEGYVFVLDQPSAVLAIRMLVEKHAGRFELHNLFGPKHTCALVAGISLPVTCDDLFSVVLEETTRKSGVIHQALRDIQATDLSELGIRLLEPRDTKSFVNITSMVARWDSVAGLALGSHRSQRHIFLSYASEDRSRVEAIKSTIQANGFRLWMDKHNLVGGQSWKDEIQRAIRDCALVVVFFSRKAVQKRGYFQTEQKLIEEVSKEIPSGKGFIIPVRLDDCELPNGVRSYQWVDCHNKQDVRDLVKALDYHLAC